MIISLILIGKKKKYNTPDNLKERHGNGTYIYANGDKYVGEWKNGKKDGQGTYTFVDGRIISGEFKKDKHWNITKYDTEGKIVGSLMKGEEVVGKKDKGSLIFRLWSGGMGWLKED